MTNFFHISYSIRILNETKPSLNKWIEIQPVRDLKTENLIQFSGVQTANTCCTLFGIIEFPPAIKFRWLRVSIHSGTFDNQKIAEKHSGIVSWRQERSEA